MTIQYQEFRITSNSRLGPRSETRSPTCNGPMCKKRGPINAEGEFSRMQLEML